MTSYVPQFANMRLMSTFYRRAILRRTRVTLLAMDDHMLRDIGVTYGDVLLGNIKN